MKTKSFKDLIVWQKSYRLVIEIYKCTRTFPKDELYGLTQQMRKASLPIPCNISEGYGRQFNKEYRHFLSIAYGSICELETQYLLSIDLGYATSSEFVEKLMSEVGAMLYRLLNPIR